jgi:hypothetical protein
MGEHLLDEYYKITKVIDNIQSKINNYKQILEDKINNTDSENERNILIEEYKSFIKNIKDDTEIKNKIIKLNTRQTEIKTILTNTNEINIIDTIEKLIKKYTPVYTNIL